MPSSLSVLESISRLRTAIYLAATSLVAGSVLVALEQPSSAVPTSPTSQYVAVQPARLLDTRVGNGGAPAAPVNGGATLSLQVTGRGGVPTTGVTAVALNVTVTQPVTIGYISVSPHGVFSPGTSNLNFGPGQTVPNLVITPLSGDGGVDLYVGSTGSAHLVADVSGYYTDTGTSSPGALGTLSGPSRLLDTRVGNGAPAAPVSGGATLNLQVTGRGGVPSTGVAAVAMNLTVTQPGAPGYITAWAHGGNRPLASNLNFAAGQTVPNLAIVPVSAGGSVDLYVGSSASTHLVADVFAYYTKGVQYVPGALGAITPARVLDTRIGNGAPAAPISGGGTVSLQIAGRGGVPQWGISAVALNVTVTQPNAPGYITVFADGSPLPETSNLNFGPGQTVPNLVIAPVGSDGKVNLYVGSTGSVHLVADVSGYILGPPAISWTAPSELNVGHAAAGVSCASATCVIADQDGYVQVNTGAGWSAPFQLSDAAALYGVLCASPTYCVAYGATVAIFSAWVFDGSTWHEQSNALPPASAYSCPQISSGMFCVGVDPSGNAYKFDGVAWSGPTAIDPSGGGFHSVSCASATFCVAVDNTGGAVAFNGQTWSARELVNGFGTAVMSVSCPTAVFCVAVDYQGNGYTRANGMWSSPVDVDWAQTNFVGISCSSPTFCLAVDQAGISYPFDGQTWLATDLSGAFQRPPVAVVCISDFDCIGVQDDGRVLTTS